MTGMFQIRSRERPQPGAHQCDLREKPLDGTIKSALVGLTLTKKQA